VPSGPPGATCFCLPMGEPAGCRPADSDQASAGRDQWRSFPGKYPFI
jgi:hypothetical protein